MLSKEQRNEIIATGLSGEYQAIWFVELASLKIQIQSADLTKSIPDSVSTVVSMNSYEKARLWYINQYIDDTDKYRVTDKSSVESIVQELSLTKHFSVEYKRVQGETINFNQLFYARVEPLGEELKHFILGFRNVDAIKRAERDTLTDVYTRDVFLQKSEELLARPTDEQYDIIMSDIVDFKAINETFGPAMGDSILRWIGKTISYQIGDNVLVGRYGGDQFVVLAPHIYVQNIAAFSLSPEYQKLLADSCFPTFITKYGIYENIKSDQPILAICDKAHMALNSIKQSYGKTVAYYDDNMDSEIRMKRTIENDMHAALKNDQFKVYYQPKHNALTGKLIGAEALIRWEHPEFGLLSPVTFIPLFEKNGFIVETDTYVWTRTCQNLRKWKDNGLETVPISVNASKVTFEVDNFFDRPHSAVADNNLSTDELHIEITETLMTGDVDTLIDKLNSIREAGYVIELDDFGSGYSSINVLCTLPIDIVKFDRSFMANFGDIKRTRVLAACIRLAKDLGFKTIAEGVEHLDQQKALAVLDVDAIQGYLFSPPIPEDEFEEYMKKYI